MNLSADMSGSHYLRYSEVDPFPFFSSSFGSMDRNTRVSEPQVMGNLCSSGPQLWPSYELNDPFKVKEVLSYRHPEKNAEEMSVEKVVKNQGQMGFVVSLNGNISGSSIFPVKTINVTSPPKGGPVGENYKSYQYMPLVYKDTLSESYPDSNALPVILLMPNVGDALGYSPNHLNAVEHNENFRLPLGHNLKHEDIISNHRNDGRMDFRACGSSHVGNENRNPLTVVQNSSTFLHKPDHEYATRALEPNTNAYEGPQAWVNRGDGWKSIDLKGQI